MSSPTRTSLYGDLTVDQALNPRPGVAIPQTGRAA
jgi:hypothetical protein